MNQPLLLLCIVTMASDSSIPPDPNVHGLCTTQFSTLLLGIKSNWVAPGGGRPHWHTYEPTWVALDGRRAHSHSHWLAKILWLEGGFAEAPADSLRSSAWGELTVFSLAHRGPLGGNTLSRLPPTH